MSTVEKSVGERTDVENLGDKTGWKRPIVNVG